MPLSTENSTSQYINRAPANFDPQKDLPQGFFDYLIPLHREFTPRQQTLIAKRAEVLQRSHGGHPPNYLPPSEATTTDWRIEVPDWCADQRNQMTGPADDAELTVKLLNSGSPAVMIDLEDSMANIWDQTLLGNKNTLAAYKYELAYDDKKRNKKVSVQRSKTVTWVRPRGLHLSQGGVVKNEIVSASLFDLALLWYQLDPATLPHNFCVYIPKSESAEEAVWWRDVVAAFLLDPGRAKELGALGRHWMTRTLLELGELNEHQGKLGEATRAWKLIGSAGLPGAAIAQEQLARLNAGPPRP